MNMNTGKNIHGAMNDISGSMNSYNDETDALHLEALTLGIIVARLHPLLEGVFMR
jgi:hypothetical protein